MTISTMADLTANMSSFLYDRTELTPNYATFINLCESDLNGFLRLREQIKSETFTPDENGEFEVPDDYQSFKTVSALTNPTRRLDHVVPGLLDAMYPARSGYPSVFSINGTTVSVRPLTESQIQFDYYANIPPLSEANPTNWLIQKAPTVYLFGALKYAALFIGDDRQAKFQAEFNNGIALLARQDKSGNYGERSISRNSGFTP